MCSSVRSAPFVTSSTLAVGRARLEPRDLLEDVLVEEQLVLQHGHERFDFRMPGDFVGDLVEERVVHAPAREDVLERGVGAHLARGLTRVDRLKLNHPRERRTRHVVVERVRPVGSPQRAVEPRPVADAAQLLAVRFHTRAIS